MFAEADGGLHLGRLEGGIGGSDSIVGIGSVGIIINIVGRRGSGEKAPVRAVLV